MKSEWKETTLGVFCPFSYGKGLTQGNRQVGKVPVYGSNGIVGFNDTAAVNSSGIIIGRKGTIGSVHLSEKPFWPIDTTFYVADSPERNLRFTYYLLLTKNLARLGADSAVPGLNRDAAHSVPINIPPLSEQRAIARILGSLDDKIELNRRMNATLELLAQTLFRAWFVDFEPVKAKAAGHAPLGLDAKTAALFPSEFEDSTLGRIPKGWTGKRLDEVFEINPNRRAPSSTYLDMANVPTQGHRPQGWVQRAPGSGMKFTNGDTLLARITPCLENGKTAFVDFLKTGEVGWGSTEFIVLRPRSPLPEYFGYLLSRHEGFRNFAIQSMTGTSGRQRVQVSSLGQYLLAVPSAKIAETFGELIQPIVIQISKNSEQSHTLTQILNGLLPRLISGQVRVRVEKFVEEPVA